MSSTRFIATLAAIAAVLTLLVSSVPAAGVAIDMGSSSDPLDSLTIGASTAYNQAYPDKAFYVKVGGTVTVTSVPDDLEILGWTDGYGLRASGDDVTGTLTKAGTIKVELADVINTQELFFYIVAVEVGGEPDDIALTFKALPAGAGSVSTQTAYVARNATVSAAEEALKANGATVCTATANPGYAFVGWSKTSGTVAVEQTIYANFIAIGTQESPINALSLTQAQAMHISGIERFYVISGGNVSIPNIDADGLRVTFTGISPDGSGLSVSNGISGKLASQDTNKEFTVAYSYNDGSGARSGSFAIVSVAQAPATTVTVSFSIVPSGSGTVEPMTVTVTPGSVFSVRGSTITIDGKTVTATAGSGYRFAGWENVPSDWRAVADTTVTARFSAIPEGTAVISYFDGSTLIGIQSVAYTSGTAKATVSQPVSVSKDGYTLKGWSVQGDESGRLVKNGDRVDVPADGLSLNAVWEKNNGFDWLPLVIIAIGAVLAMLGIVVHFGLTIAGIAVAVIGALELLGAINLF